MSAARSRKLSGPSRVVVVRHAEPATDPLREPRLWPLSPAGREAATQLRGRLPASGRWVSSTETRAHETLLRADGDRVTQDARFDEVRRVEPFDDGFRERRRAWVRGDLDAGHAGWETPTDAADRFELGIREHTTPGMPLVVASHGMVITAWLVHARGLLDLSEAASFWERLAFPDVIEIKAEQTDLRPR